MHEDEANNGSNPTQYIAVELVFDEDSNFLNAHLSLTDIDPQINWSSLQQMIVAEGYESFKLPGTVLQDLLRKAQGGNSGVFPLGEKPVYTAVRLLVDNESKSLDAELIEADSDQNINLMSLQEMIKDNNFDAYKINGAALQQLIKRIEKNDFGVYKIGELPEFTAVELEYSDETRVLSACLNSTYEGSELSFDDIQQLIKDKGYDSFFFAENELDKLFARVEKQERGTFPIARKKDAEITIELSEDKMKATISTTPAYGGKALSENDIRLEIDALKLDRKNCNDEVVQQAVNHELLDKVILANGAPSVSGVDAYFTALVEEVIYSEPKVNKKGVADLREVNDFTVVEIDTPLMKKTPATAGQPGLNVLGQVVIALAGKDKDFDKDLNGSAQDPNNENLLIAINKGHPIIRECSVDIDKTLHVKNVNPRIGNVNFDGSLMVDGDVTAGVKIDVTGTIVIKGIVTHASIKAGGDITINGGVIGDVSESHDEGKERKSESSDEVATELIAGGEIKAKYLSLTSAAADKNIIVAEYCSHCNIATQSKFLLGHEGGKGRLMGGTCYAKQGVYAKVLGTDANIHTYVKAGYLPAVQSKHEELVAKRKSLVAEANQITASLNQIIGESKKVSLPAEKVAAAKKYRSIITEHKNEIGEMGKKIKRLKAMVKKYRTTSIDVGAKVYPNVFVTVNAAEYTIRSESKGGKFIRVGNDIRWEA